MVIFHCLSTHAFFLVVIHWDFEGFGYSGRAVIILLLLEHVGVDVAVCSRTGRSCTGQTTGNRI